MASSSELSARSTLSAKLARALAFAISFWKQLPPKRRWALGGSVLLLVLLVWFLPGSGSGTLKLVFRHDLDSADASVRVDGKLVDSLHLSRSVKRRLPFLDKSASTSTRNLSVASGSHVVEVHVQSDDGEYNQTRRCGVNIPSGQQATLVISSLRGGIGLAYEGVPVAPSGGPDSDYSGYLRSIMVTVVGSAVSAAIGFMVQEALRKRKSEVPLPAASTPDAPERT